jgi:hypothetical protein
MKIQCPHMRNGCTFVLRLSSENNNITSMSEDVTKSVSFGTYHCR